MEQRKLEIHTFHLKQPRKQDITIDPKDVDGKDLYKLLSKEFPTFIDEFPPSKLYGKTTKIPLNGDAKSIFFSKSQNRIVYGKINIGDDNKKEQDVVESNKDKKFLYTKMKGHSVERPFFFLILLPDTKTTGFLILEREGKHAMKRDFEKILNEFTTEKLSGLKVKFTNFVESDLVKEWLEKGEYKEVILRRRELPNDKAEHYGEFLDEGKFDVRLSIVPKEKTIFTPNKKKKIAQNIDEYNGFFESEELKEIGFDKNSEIKVVIDHEGNTRTIDLSDTNKVRPYYHVNVKTNAAGFSEIESIKNEAINLIKQFNLGII